MSKVIGAALAGVLALLGGAAWLTASRPKPLDGSPRPVLETASAERSSEPILPIPPPIELDEKKLRLGERLFHDPRLSRNDTTSCATCHDVARGGDDGLERSVGIDGHQTRRNSPTVLNSAFNFRQFWDGRARTLEEQVDGPIRHPGEMDSSWERAASKLAADPDFRREFEKVYAGGVRPATVKEALVAYVASLTTPGAPFDRYLMGREDAISPLAREGYLIFKRKGCIGCHQGVNVGGNLFARLGAIEERGSEGAHAPEEDLGRFEQTGREEDRHVFKVPGLRNVALTEPYFHDGSIDTLEGAIRVMARRQLGVTLKPREVEALAEFLSSLTGEPPARMR